MTGYCPHCGRELKPRRLGVELTVLKARIFDAIRRAGVDGISCDDLINELGIPVTRSSMRAHIVQINDKLMDTCWRIQGGGYRLEREMQP